MNKLIIPILLSIFIFFIPFDNASANTDYVDRLKDEGWRYIYKFDNFGYIGVNKPLKAYDNKYYLEVVGGVSTDRYVWVSFSGAFQYRDVIKRTDADNVYIVRVDHNLNPGEVADPFFRAAPAVSLIAVEEIPQVMTKTMVDGGLLSTGLIVLAILLGVLLVRRFPFWFLR